MLGEGLGVEEEESFDHQLPKSAGATLGALKPRGPAEVAQATPS